MSTRSQRASSPFGCAGYPPVRGCKQLHRTGDFSSLRTLLRSPDVVRCTPRTRFVATSRVRGFFLGAHVVTPHVRNFPVRFHLAAEPGLLLRGATEEPNIFDRPGSVLLRHVLVRVLWALSAFGQGGMKLLQCSEPPVCSRAARHAVTPQAGGDLLPIWVPAAP
jgi:hypothetical protein